MDTVTRIASAIGRVIRSRLFGVAALAVVSTVMVAVVSMNIDVYKRQVLINAVVIGAELAVAYYTQLTPGILLFNMLCVGAGQLAACVVCGLLLHAALYRSGAAGILFRRPTE